jgi:hypothetical protein
MNPHLERRFASRLGRLGELDLEPAPPIDGPTCQRSGQQPWTAAWRIAPRASTSPVHCVDRVADDQAKTSVSSDRER